MPAFIANSPAIARHARLLAMALACAAVAACGDREVAAQAGGGRNAPVPVTVERVREQPWTDSLRALGTVKARESVTLTAKVSETVQQVHFESGQDVARGARLVTLSGQQQVAALASAEAAAREAEQSYQRQSLLASQQLIARASLDTQRAARDSARAQVAQIRANLSDRVVRAPFAGVLGLRQVSPGALVTPGTVITTLDDVARVYVDFPVPETDLANVAPGQALVGTSDTWAGRSFDGTVAAVATRLDVGSRAAMVRGDFPNPDRALKPGMLVQVSLTRGEKPALVVPEIAVQQVGSETFVWRVRQDDTVEKANVEVGGRVPGKAMLRSGVKPGDRIVTAGVGKLQPGAKISVGPRGTQAAGTARTAEGDPAPAAR